jgi:hypothetical protein
MGLEKRVVPRIIVDVRVLLPIGVGTLGVQARQQQCLAVFGAEFAGRGLEQRRVAVQDPSFLEHSSSVRAGNARSNW